MLDVAEDNINKSNKNVKEAVVELEGVTIIILFKLGKSRA